jgi:hypothetical protein
MHRGYENRQFETLRIFFSLAFILSFTLKSLKCFFFLEDFQKKFLYEFLIFSMRAVCPAKYFVNSTVYSISANRISNNVQVLVAGIKLAVGWIIISSNFNISIAVCGLSRFRIPDVAQLGSWIRNSCMSVEL